jgi:hypothetical protein
LAVPVSCLNATRRAEIIGEMKLGPIPPLLISL